MMKFRLLLFLLTAFLGSQMFGLQVVKAVAGCCIYFEELLNKTNDKCIDLITGTSSFVNTASASCPDKTYSNRLIGSYGYGVNIGIVQNEAMTSYSLPNEPTSLIYEKSSMAEVCLDPGPIQIEGVSVALEIETDADGGELCGKGISFMSTPNGEQLRKQLVQAQFDDLRNTLKNIAKDTEYDACCVPIVENVATTQCIARGENYSLLEQKLKLYNPDTAALNFMYFPTDAELPDFLTCSINASKRDWVEYSVDMEKNAISALDPEIKYVAYPEKCTSQTGSNYIPPWGFGNTSQTPQQLKAMCNQASDKFCACTADKKYCQEKPFFDQAECQADLPTIKFTDGSAPTDCVLLDESQGPKIDCKSIVIQDGATKGQKKLDGTTNGFVLLSTSGLNPLGATTVQQLIGRMISIGMGIIGSIALVIVVYGGFMWMIAGGNAEQEKTALQTLFWGGIGIGIILSSYAIVRFVFSSFN